MILIKVRVRDKAYRPRSIRNPQEMNSFIYQKGRDLKWNIHLTFIQNSTDALTQPNAVTPRYTKQYLWLSVSVHRFNTAGCDGRSIREQYREWNILSDNKCLNPSVLVSRSLEIN